MSGGAFNYAYTHISRLADEIECESLRDPRDDAATKMSEETHKLLKQFHTNLTRYADAARIVEWFFSGDIGEDTLNKSLSDLLTGESVLVRLTEAQLTASVALLLSDTGGRHPSLTRYVVRQKEWSERTFGSGKRVVGICKHIEKELAEVVESDGALEEWVDVVILGLDGAWRSGASPLQVVQALLAKQEVNRNRQWPAPGPEDQPTEHVRHVFVKVPCEACGGRGTTVIGELDSEVTVDCPHCDRDGLMTVRQEI